MPNPKLFREPFETYNPSSPDSPWQERVGDGDLTYVDGNASGTSYLVISKSPLLAGTQTDVETKQAYDLPLDVNFGLSMSQNTLGQELSVEVVDPNKLPDIEDLEIASITQTTTVLTVDTVKPHGLVPGKAIGIAGCSNPVANYPALVVASIPSPTQLTATAGPGGTIPSQTITNPAGAKGSVFFRERFGRSKNGIAQIFENASATQASLYVRSEAGDGFPSGTIAGQHVVTVGSRAPVQLVNSKDTFAFGPTTEYRMLAQGERSQWSDSPVDSVAQATNRLVRSQITPSGKACYRLRFRANNSKSLTVPVAQIVSVTKTGTTTATVVCDRAHGLALGDPIAAYGARDQTNFANLTAATAVASIVDANTFTVVWGAAVTATTFGGYVSKVMGGNLPSALGANVIAAQTAVLVTRVDGTRELTLTGNTNWGGLSIGDMVELVGVRNAVDGATLGIDGAWKVANVATTTLVLVLPYAGQREVIPDFVVVNCGGGVIKRTDTRVSFVRLIAHDSQWIVGTPRPSSDIAAAAPVAVQNTVATTLSSTAVAGTVAADAAVGNPVGTGGRAANANPTAVSAAGDLVNDLSTMLGAKVVKPYAIPEAEWATTLALTAITDVAIQAAAPTGIKRHLTWLDLHNSGASAVDVLIRDGTTTRLQITVAAGQSKVLQLPTGITTTAATALNVQLSAAGTVRLNAGGYTAP